MRLDDYFEGMCVYNWYDWLMFAKDNTADGLAYRSIMSGVYYWTKNYEPELLEEGE